MGSAMGQDPEILEEVCGWVMEAATVPGAIRMTPDALAERHHEIPRDREVVLVCT